MKKPILTIQDWDTGIADDPYKGFQMVKNLNDNMTGIASCGFCLENNSFAQSNITFTAAADDVITTSSNWVGSNSQRFGVAVTFTTTGTLPAGLSTGTTYYTYWLSNTTFKVCTTLSNVDATTFVDITDAGTGTHTVVFTRMGKITQIAQDSRTNYWYGVDSNGRVWSNEWTASYFTLIGGNTLTAASGNGIAVWKNYVLVFRNALVDAYGPLTSALASRAWTNGFFALGTTGLTTGDHQAIASLNDKLYWCDGNNVGYLSEDAGKTFTPSDNTTFSPDSYSSALDLPDGFIVKYLEDYGNYIAVAATKSKKSYVFPWDRVSSSFNFSVEIPETTIQSMQNINNVLYVVTNERAAVYATNLSSVEQIKKIPLHLSMATNPNTGTVSIGSSAKIGGRLYLGITAGTSTVGNTGIYILNLKTGVLKMINTLSTGVTTSASSLNIGAIGQIGQFNDGTPYYFVTYSTFTSTYLGSTDKTSDSRLPYTNFEPQIITPFYQVSTDPLEQTPITRAVFYFQVALDSSDGIKLEYREYDTQAWTELGTYTGSTQKQDQIPLVRMEFHINVTQVQFRISLDAGGTFVRLKKVDIF